ncbi:MAG: M48 family metalloprotease [Gemmatimonadetes bacterium]|nr:M48 family metalloprotease [Gemmatimonadota bacterium]
MYFEILIAATRFNRVIERTYIPPEFQGSRYNPRYPKHQTRFTMGFRYLPWDFSKKVYLQEEIYVVRVTKGSPAEKAGLKAWDRIVSINGKNDWKSAKDFEKLLEKSISKTKYKKYNSLAILGVKRDTSTLSIEIEMIEILDFNLIQLESPKVAAFADGKNVYITRGMVEFAKNDDETRFILAHELSHNIMRHSKTKKLGAILGGFFGAALDIGLGHINNGYIYTDFTKLFSEIGKIVHSKKHEREADYLAMYIVTAAGGDVSNVLNLWRRIAIEELRTTGTLSEGATHPSDPERSLLMLATFKEIEEKREKGMKVFPTIKK